MWLVEACEMYPNLDLEGNMQPEIYMYLINAKNWSHKYLCEQVRKRMQPVELAY